MERNPDVAVLEPGEPCSDVEVLTPRDVPLGGPRAMPVARTLPQRKRSLVGSWCFLDHYGPDDVSVTGGMSVPRHPHTGLATVSWLFSGEIDHLDSGGNAARVVPGELNLMIAGRGITHQEISTDQTRILHGVQLWYALPDATRFSENHFAHYVPEPVSPAPGVSARVFIGSLAGSASPVDTRTPDLLGAELTLEAGASVTLEARRDFEYAVLAESGDARVNGMAIAHRELAYVPTGSDSLTIAVEDAARVILLGGVPFAEQIVMWWNFVGRTHDEVAEFRRRYQAEMGFEPGESPDPLFGDFPSGQPDALPAPRPAERAAAPARVRNNDHGNC
ncbi:pirin family protein [Microbacterium gubbeenense]|uniref:pirin family protein n=1 Tax=Microbacterium gubbeenense TaxID=159896 RepID=UPI003F944A6B